MSACQNTGNGVVLVTEIPFWRLEKGVHQRISALVRVLLDAGCPVDIFYTTRLRASERATLVREYPAAGVTCPPLALLIVRAVRRRLGIRFPGERPDEPAAWERRWALRRLCRQVTPRFVIVEYLWSGYLVEGLRENLSAPPKLLLDTIDLMHERALRLASGGVKGGRPITREEEAAALAAYDGLIAIQDWEASVFRDMRPNTDVLVAGHGHAVYPPHARDGSPVRLLFVGAGGAHNRAAIAGFLEDVWPVLRAAHGEAVALDIAGSVCDALNPAQELPAGVRLLGFVADLDAVYAQADIVVNPVFAGSGLKIKNVEALCRGLPLVTTPCGAEGLEAGLGTAFVTGDSPESLRQELESLVADVGKRRELARGAHAFAQVHLSFEAAYGPLLRYLGAPEQDCRLDPRPPRGQF